MLYVITNVCKELEVSKGNISAYTSSLLRGISRGWGLKTVAQGTF